MKSITAILITSFAFFISVSCEKKSDLPARVDAATLADFLRIFDDTSQDRSETVHHSTTVMFDDLSYFVATREPKVIDAKNWEYVFEGPSRQSGYFVVPRMEWAETIADVEKIIREDYSRGVGIPTSKLIK